MQTGAIRIIGAISDGRSKYFPDAPTMAEQGFAEAQVTPWFGVVVPAATPQPVVDRISRALEAALATSDVRQKLDTAGCEAKSAPLGQFADIIKADVALWGKVVKEAGITAIRAVTIYGLALPSGRFPRGRKPSYIAAVRSPV